MKSHRLDNKINVTLEDLRFSIVRLYVILTLAIVVTLSYMTFSGQLSILLLMLSIALSGTLYASVISDAMQVKLIDYSIKNNVPILESTMCMLNFFKAMPIIFCVMIRFMFGGYAEC